MYSACGPFTDNKEEIEQYLKKLIIQDISSKQNDL